MPKLAPTKSYSTPNTKLAVVLATMGIPLRPVEPANRNVSRRGEQTVWHFLTEGVWQSYDGQLKQPIKTSEVVSAFLGRKHDLSREAFAELSVMVRALNDRDALYSVLKSGRVTEAYIAELLLDNRNRMRDMVKQTHKTIFVERAGGNIMAGEHIDPQKLKELERYNG